MYTIIYQSKKLTSHISLFNFNENLVFILKLCAGKNNILGRNFTPITLQYCYTSLNLVCTPVTSGVVRLDDYRQSIATID